MRKKVFIFCGLVSVLLIVVNLFQPRRTICVLDPWRFTVSSITTGRFIESIAFSAHVVDTSTQEIIADLDELYFSRVSLGLKAWTTINSKDFLFVITQIDSVESNDRFKITLAPLDTALTFVSKNGSLRMRLKISETENVVQLPVGGFYKDSEGKFVYVVLPYGNAVKRNVVFGRRNPEYLEVLSGLAPGEQVITSSYENFMDRDYLDMATIRDLSD